MSIYSELLRLALLEQRAEDVASQSVEELVEALVARRIQLVTSRAEMSPSATRGAEWTADLITHDVALVRLCDRLGIEQALTEPSAPPIERERLLSALAAKRIGSGGTRSIDAGTREAKEQWVRSISPKVAARRVPRRP